MEGVRIRLSQQAAVLGVDRIFVDVIPLHSRLKNFPDAALNVLHLAVFRVPVIEVAHQTDGHSVGGPDPEAIAVLTIYLVGMCAQESVGIIGAATQKTGDSCIGCALFFCSHG